MAQADEISNRDLYVELVRLQVKVEVLADHEARIRGLERWKYALPINFIASIGATAVSLAAILGKH
jgi:hypothetical protein